MKTFHYSIEKNVQICIALFKANNIKKIVASPGSTNIPFVGSVQGDPWFEVYSCVDERSAAYMACGLAAESAEPVVLTCTGATASRNYMSGLTEAFYRRLPIIALTSTRPLSSIGNLSAQVIDRTAIPNDIVTRSVFAPLGRNEREEWDCKIQVSRALSSLRRNGGGPVHINLETECSFDFSVEEIKDIQPIEYIKINDSFPKIPQGGKIGIYVASHSPFNNELTIAIENFCEIYNCVVLCDSTSNYKGKYKIMSSLLGGQDQYDSVIFHLDLMIYIGHISGAYESMHLIQRAKEMWRISDDEEIRAPYHNLTKTFAMSEYDFFGYYINGVQEKYHTSLYEVCLKDYNNLYSKISSDLPFSNIWIAYQMAHEMPNNSVMHFAILNSLRAWNFFEVSNSIYGYSNVGGFGIDGCLSSLVGASLCHKDKLYFGIVGDLSFFYDMNVLGNRHIGNNIRILLVNNGRGMEFRNYTHPASQFSDELVDKYICAAGHYGYQSKTLVSDYAKNVGFKYISASNKETFLSQMRDFINPNIQDAPMIFEVFTEQEEENNALHQIRNLEVSTKSLAKNFIKDTIVGVLGTEGFNKIKGLIK
ncbi:MAG: 2-succinyl-5-enolpyruvyl-6-hydroxy-3-cyclohexene-1-carboxylate synthase [Bacteroidales bacterium]|nr:2-succinyl-5-enolpyruvyl-6-hydroxy-3-cyclohexene-1-carboxylate synthase [Bacteroidales bacterium]